MEEEESLRSTLAVALIQHLDLLQRRPQITIVLRSRFRGRIGEVGDERETQLRVRIGEKVDFQTVRENLRALWPQQHGRHDHEGGAVVRYAILEV